jgi:hypothetical protein
LHWWNVEKSLSQDETGRREKGRESAREKGRDSGREGGREIRKNEKRTAMRGITRDKKVQ